MSKILVAISLMLSLCWNDCIESYSILTVNNCKTIHRRFPAPPKDVEHNHHYQRQRQQRYYDRPALSLTIQSTKRYIEIPLFDLTSTTDSSSNNSKEQESIMVQPLPSLHLQQQDEDLYNSLHVYGMKLTIPLHQQIINHACDKVVAATASDIISNTISNDGNNNDDIAATSTTVLPSYYDPMKVPLVGVIAYKPSTSSSSTSSSLSPYVGAVGCVVEILYNVPTTTSSSTNPKDEYIQQQRTSDDNNAKNKRTKKSMIDYNTPSKSKTVVSRGLYRFIVRDIKQSIPYTVAYVEELFDDTNDDNIDESNTVQSTKTNSSNSIDDLCISNMTGAELVQRILQSVQLTIERMTDNVNQLSNQGSLSPLEESILQDNGILLPKQQQQIIQDMVQEYRTIYNKFYTLLIDDITFYQQRYYSVPIFATEICHFNNTIRQQILTTTNRLERLRIVYSAITESIDTNAILSFPLSSNTIVLSSTPSLSQQQQQKQQQQQSTIGTTKSIKEANEDDYDVSDAIKDIIGNSGVNAKKSGIVSKQDLTVGAPSLPLWSKQIKKGTVLEYYWNDEYGWCRGQVIDEPLRIVSDEMILTVHFIDDDTTHRLPFSADEKVRWRPPTNPSPFA